MDSEQTLHSLMQSLPQQGRVEWIGIRPGKRQPVVSVAQACAVVHRGLEGDHYSGRSGGRGITLLQAEHLPVVASMLHLGKVRPEALRRNILVSGINLLALKNRRFSLGDAVLEMTGVCHPCSRMEQVLGAGGYNAMRGHGGITAQVLSGGLVRVGDRLTVIGVR